MKIYQSPVQKDIVHIISGLKKVKPKVILRRKLFSELGLDLVDVVDIILKVERRYEVVIPDEVLIRSIDDIVSYIEHCRGGAV